MRRTSWLINRDFARLWAGQAVSTLGDYVFETTLVLWIGAVLGRGRPWAPAAVSGLMLCVVVVAAAVGPLAGVFVDRWNRIATMLHTELFRGAVVAVMTVLAFLPRHALPTGAWLAVIYSTVVLVTAGGLFFTPARLAVVGDVVSGDADRTRAMGVTQATTATCAILGPPLAAPLLFTVGFQWALVLNALSYLVSYVAIRSVRVAPAVPDPGGGRPALGREFVAGLRYFAGNRTLTALLGMAFICQCGTGAINALDLFFVTGNLHAPERLYGFMATGFGLGTIAGSLCSARVVRRIGARTTTWLTLLVGGLLYLVYARQHAFWPGVVLLAAFAVPIAVLNASINPLVLSATPRAYLGRVAAVFTPANALAQTLSVVVAGWLASTALRGFHATVAGFRFTAIDTIFTASAVLVLAGAGFAAVALPREPKRTPAAATPVDVPA